MESVENATRLAGVKKLRSISLFDIFESEKLGADKMAQSAPLRRLGDDEDLKGLVVLYASDAGKHITGQWMAVDGGVSAIIGG